jgi:hypothetical protein
MPIRHLTRFSGVSAAGWLLSSEGRPVIRTVCTALLTLLATWGAAHSQEGGTAAGTRRADVFDALSRPITAGGLVDGAPVVFEDITAASGLELFRHRAGYPEKRYIVDTKSAGVAAFDYDRDGWLDIYLLNGSPFEALLGKALHGESRLFRNNGDLTFTDVTERAGVANRQWAFGAVAGDFDGDGWTDLYVSNFGPNRLYRNNGDGTFTDVAARAGVALADSLTTGAAFGDYNRDGRLDLFVCGYAEFDPSLPPRPGVDIPINFCRYRGDPVMCGPRGLPGTRDFLFRNQGDGTFAEVAVHAGVHDPGGGYGFTAVWLDLNDDGWSDLLVVNDSTPNYLYVNQRDGTFREIGYTSGFALSEDGRAQAGMGLAVGDYNLDGRVDLYVAHFGDDYNTLYRNEGDLFFLDVSWEAGVAEPSLPFVGWGTGFLDYDNDGLLDLFVANGHVYPEVDRHPWGTSFRQRPLLFRNLDGQRFEPVPPAPDTGLAMVVTARGAAFGDFDNDGRTDVVINCVDSPPKLLRNVFPGGNWLGVELVPGPDSLPQGIGSVVWLDAGGRRQRRDVYTGGSFASHSDLRPLFGLGAVSRVERLEIRWPSGTVQVVEGLAVNRYHRITERPASTAGRLIP